MRQLSRHPLGCCNHHLNIKYMTYKYILPRFLIVISFIGCASTHQITESTSIIQSVHSFNMNGSAAIIGSVVDANSLETLIGANVFDTTRTRHLGAVTDTCGNYELIGISPGTYVIAAFSVEYRKVCSSIIHLYPNQLVILDFRLAEKPPLNIEVTKQQPNQALKLTE
jgi:hypothetical protein